MNVQLGDIAQLQFGLYAKPTDAGNAVYFQAKHFDEWGDRAELVDAFIEIDSKNQSHLLEDGDILFVGKGMRNFAWTYDKVYGPAIASSIFFVIKSDRSKVLPEFLTTLFNLPQTQAYFQSLGAGSSIPSIRKSELEAFTLKLPGLEVQKEAIRIKQLHYFDMDLSKRIISEKQRLFQAVIRKLINQNA